MKYKLLILLFAAILFAQVPGTWETFGDANFANCIATHNGVLYVGSKGGIIEYLPGTPVEDLKVMTNIHGLGGLNIVGLQEHGEKLFYAASNGAMGRLDGGKWSVFTDLLRDNVGINDIAVSEEHFYVATSKGVSQIKPLSGNLVLEVSQNYNKISSWDRNYPINSITADDTLLWVGSNLGIARGRLGGNLFVPEAWTIFSTNRPVLDVFADSGGIWYILEYELGSLSIFFFDGERVDTLEDSFMLGRRLNGFFYYNGELYAHGHDGLFRRRDTGRFTRVPLDAHWAVHGGAALGDSLYVPLEIGFGVLRQDTIRHMSINSPSGDAFRGVAFAPNGDVAIVSGGSGVCIYSNGTWGNITAKYMPTIPSDSVYTQVRNNLHHINKCAYDANGNLWLGMTGDGVFRYSPDGVWKIFDKTNSILDGYSAGPNAPLCWGLDYDEVRGLMWISNYDNLSGLAVAAFEPEGDLTSPIVSYFTGTAAIPNNYVMSLTAQGGDVWLVLRDQGVTLIDPGYNISSHSDDYVRNYSDVLPGASANQVAVDSEGIAWVAVSGGVASINTNLGLVTEQILPENLSTFVSGITVDPDDNIWICTDAGAGVFRRADSTWIAIRSNFAQGVLDYERTDLATELLYAVGYNTLTGDVWFCGENAISVLHVGTDFSAQEDLFIYPNPFIWDGFAGNNIRIAKMPADAEVHIYTSDGSLVRTISRSERTSLAFAEWDGRNEAGKPVSTGVYVVVASNGETVLRGKIALIRGDK